MFWSISNQYPDSVTLLHVQTDSSQNSAFIKNLDQDSKGLFLLGCLPSTFDSMPLTVIPASSHRQLAKSTSCSLKDYVSLSLRGFVNSLFLNFIVFYQDRSFYVFLRLYFSIFLTRSCI